MKAKNTICLWFDNDALDAARFYAANFPSSEVTAVYKAPADYPSGKAGDILMVEFTVVGIPCLGLNGDRRLGIARLSRSRSQRTTKKRPIGTGIQSWAMEVRKALAVGARTGGDFLGRSHHAR